MVLCVLLHKHIVLIIFCYCSFSFCFRILTFSSLYCDLFIKVLIRILPCFLVHFSLKEHKWLNRGTCLQYHAFRWIFSAKPKLRCLLLLILLQRYSCVSPCIINYCFPKCITSFGWKTSLLMAGC